MRLIHLRNRFRMGTEPMSRCSGSSWIRRGPRLTHVSITIGVDVGGTKILGGLVAEDGSILTTTRKPTPRNDAMDVLEVVASVIEELQTEPPAPVTAVGVGIAGAIDVTMSTVIWAPNLHWTNVPARAVLEGRTGLPVIIENDGNTAAWAEHRFGAGQGTGEMVMVTVGTGVGGGIIHEGRLLRGAHGGAGEIGHLTMVVDGQPCGCGLRGCLEQYASGSALVRTARSLAANRRQEAALLLGLGDGTPEGVQGIHVTQAARAGDPVAIEAFNVTGTWLGRGLASLSQVLDPAAYVIGGGVGEAGDLLLGSVRQSLRENIGGMGRNPVPQVRQATLGNDAGLIGAGDLARTVQR
jgi:glucokinase